MKTKWIFVSVVGVLGLCLPQTVSAQCDAYGGLFGGTCWGGYFSPSTYSGEPVPYFSLHPPVYYSYRVPRTYGYSPFPYPPGVLTPGSEPPRAAVTQNVYTMGSGEMPEGQQDRQPLRIDNPFVEQPDRPDVTKAGKPAGRQPQVVYPAALAYKTR